MSYPNAMMEEMEKVKEMETLEENVWLNLPYNVFLHILHFLEPLDITRFGRVCTDWYKYAKDDVLWRDIFCCKMKLQSAGKLDKKLEVRQKQFNPKDGFTWYEEFQRIHCQTPCQLAYVIDDHKDEVLHVAFSNNGKLIATSSRDCCVGIYNVEEMCIELKYKINVFFVELKGYVQCSEFSPDDQFLLVSGVSTQNSFRGEIFIYSLGNEHSQSRGVKRIINHFINEPYDVFGAWLDTNNVLAGTFHFRDDDDNDSVSELWVYDIWGRSNQKVLSMNNYYQSTIRMVTIYNRMTHEPSKVGHSHVGHSEVGHSCDSKTMVYSHGKITHTPHQVIIQKIRWPHSVDVEVNAESLSCSQQFETKTIETEAQIIGIDISLDEKYLYVNCRPWSTKPGPDFTNTPEITNNIELRVYDIETSEIIKTHMGHQSFTDNSGCFFIFVNVSELLVASGAEDKHVHIWDRHFGCKVATLPGHTNVVNAVAFNQTNPEMLASASDDHTVRIWISRNLMKTYGVKDVPRTSQQQHDDVQTIPIYDYD